MKISARTDYALRAMIELAALGRVASGPDIAEHQQIPPQFLDAILADLRRSGLIVSQRGFGGGFRLARAPGEITLADVLQAVDGPLTTIRGEEPQNLRYEGSSQPLQSVWVAVRAGLRSILESVTLEEIARNDLPAIVTDGVADQRAWQ